MVDIKKIGDVENRIVFEFIDRDLNKVKANSQVDSDNHVLKDGSILFDSDQGPMYHIIDDGKIRIVKYELDHYDDGEAVYNPVRVIDAPSMCAAKEIVMLVLDAGNDGFMAAY